MGIMDTVTSFAVAGVGNSVLPDELKSLVAQLTGRSETTVAGLFQSPFAFDTPQGVVAAPVSVAAPVVTNRTLS